MKRSRWFQNPNTRLIIALAAALGMGQTIMRALTENFGFFAGMIGGAAATAILALGFALLLNATSKPNPSAKDG